MDRQDENLPIGTLLKQAGLISEEQIQSALMTQSKYSSMKLGEILALQGHIKQNTVEFFVNKWKNTKQQGKQFPLGYYLNKAALLDDKQIKTILIEQQKNKLKFGILAVKKGWIRQDTIEFFLNNLTTKPIQTLSLATLEKYNDKILHLEQKASNPSAVLKEILSWTGGHSILTKVLCQLVINSDGFIPRGIEKITIKNLVINSLINNWKTNPAAEYLRNIEYNLINNKKCRPASLLKLYRQILLQGEIVADRSTEQEELINLGLVVKQNNKLKVGNRIYQYAFNPGWVEKQLLTLRQSTTTKASKPKPNKIEPATKLASIATLLAIFLLTPLIIVVNNYNNNSSNTIESSEYESLTNLCETPISTASNSTLEIINKLEKNKQLLQEKFPENCEAMLHKLWVLAAPTLGKSDRVIEAINYLCKVPPNSASFNQAKFWLKNWYNSPNWGEQTRSYVNLISNCPAAE
ncbi:MAG: hypothetical protein Tsb0014_43040 [Pleurocapsa sp.]